MADKVRIKDIAENQGSLSALLTEFCTIARTYPRQHAKGGKVLKEINYQPNMYASALAYNKSYTFTA